MYALAPLALVHALFVRVAATRQVRGVRVCLGVSPPHAGREIVKMMCCCRYARDEKVGSALISPLLLHRHHRVTHATPYPTQAVFFQSSALNGSRRQIKHCE